VANKKEAHATYIESRGGDILIQGTGRSTTASRSTSPSSPTYINKGLVVALLDSADEKIKLEEAKAEAAKVVAHSTLLQAMNRGGPIPNVEWGQFS
jgi:hypothetical protein